MRLLAVVTSLMFLLASLAGCSPAGVETQTVTPSPPAASQTLPPVTLQAQDTPAFPEKTLQPQVTPIPLETETMSTPDASPPAYDPAMEPLVQLAREDLAQRLGIPESQIEVVLAEGVVWSNTGMGCPQPGMAYLQVPQDGARIRLSAGGQVFDYHSGGNLLPFLCENPAE